MSGDDVLFGLAAFAIIALILVSIVTVEEVGRLRERVTALESKARRESQ